ncbi:MAG: hypothetical protein ACOWWM_20975 [Desulfobacterales bacterium]
MAFKPRSSSDAIELSEPSSSDLRGRQSVRATFKLTARAIDTISIVSVHLGIKQKSLFDHLIEDSRSLVSIAQQIQPDRFRELDRVQKTFVLSRSTLLKLDSASRRFKMPRDALVEYSIRRLKAIIEEEREKHEIRKSLLPEARRLVEHGQELLSRCRELLGDEDPFTASVYNAVRGCAVAGQNVEQMVERGKVIEDY